MHSCIQALIGNKAFNLFLKISTLGMLIVVLEGMFYSVMKEYLKSSMLDRIFTYLLCAWLFLVHPFANISMDSWGTFTS